MALIDEAVAFLRSSNQLPTAEVARGFNMNRKTLSKRFQGKTGSLAKMSWVTAWLSSGSRLIKGPIDIFYNF
jgi:hypothetical protein